MKRILLIVLLCSVARLLLALEPARVDIMFNPATDGPIRIEQPARYVPVSGPSVGPSAICTSSLSFAPGASGMAVLVPCTPSSQPKRENR